MVFSCSKGRERDFPASASEIGHVSARREAFDGVTLEVQQRAWPVERRTILSDAIPMHIDLASSREAGHETVLLRAGLGTPAAVVGNGSSTRGAC